MKSNFRSILSTINNEKTLLIVTLSILIYSVVIRMQFLDSHFSHVDDFIPALVELEQKDINVTGLNTLKEYFYQNLFFKVPRSSTYAPFQFLITDFSLDRPSNYSETLLYSRLPSFLFFLLGLPILVLLSRKLRETEWFQIFAIMVVIYSFSWMSIVYSVQSNSYVIGVIANLILFYFILIEHQISSSWRRILCHFLIGFLVLFNYQMLIFLAAFFLVRVSRIFRSFTWTNLVQEVREIGVASISLFYGYWFFIRRVSNRGINWNAGSNQEFVFHIPDGDLLFQLQYVIKFFVSNSIIVANAITTPIINGGTNGISLTLVLIGFLIFGLFKVFNSKNGGFRKFGHFTIVSVLFWMIFIVTGKFALSPTRHSLILLPFLLVYCSYGLISLIEKLKILREKSYFVVLILILSYVGSFSLYSARETNNRIDAFDENTFTEIVKKNDVDFIIGVDWTANHLFTKIIRDSFVFKKIRNNILVASDYAVVRKQIITTSEKRKRLMFFSHRDQIDLDRFSLKYNSVSVYTRTRKSYTEICPTNRTSNGTNSLYYVVLEASNKEIAKIFDHF